MQSLYQIIRSLRDVQSVDPAFAAERVRQMKSNIWGGATATLAAQAADFVAGKGNASPSAIRMSREQLHEALIQKLLQMGDAVNELFHDWCARILIPWPCRRALFGPVSSL